MEILKWGTSFSQKLDSSPRQIQASFAHLHAAKDRNPADANDRGSDDRQHGSRHSHAHSVRSIPVRWHCEGNRLRGNRDIYSGEASSSVCWSEVNNVCLRTGVGVRTTEHGSRPCPWIGHLLVVLNQLRIHTCNFNYHLRN